MAEAPEIKVKLTAEDQGVSAAIKELTSQLKNLKKQQDETASSGFSLSKAFQGLAAGAALLGLARIGKEALDSAVNIGKMADKTGASTETLSVFHHVAEELGVSTEAVDKALVKGGKSITQFAQGSKTAAQGFALLGLTQKNFAGLNSDQKLLLVTNSLGKMTAGLQKTTAAQLIFSKSGAEIIPVANAIAGEGFDKISASVSKLGLLLTRDMTDSAQAARASLQELADVGTGMATQFEVGLLPAISDVAEAMLGVSEKGIDGFQQIGKVAGNAVRDLAFAFFAFGDSVGAIIAQIGVEFSALWDEVKTGGKSVFEAFGLQARGDFVGAWRALKDGARDVARNHAQIASEIKAIWDQTAVDIRKKQEDLFPSEQEEKRRAKERIARLRPDKTSEVPLPPLAAVHPNDAAEKAAFAFLQKQLEDELAIHRAYAKQTEEVEKEQYDDGLLSLADYFERRRAALYKDTTEEIAILEAERVNAQALADKTGKEAGGTKDPKAKDKLLAEQISAKEKVAELDTKIQLAGIAASTKSHALDLEQTKAEEARQKKLLTFQNELLVAQGKTFEAERQKIIAEGEEMKRSLAQAGKSAVDVDQLTQTRLQTLAFEQQQKSEQNALQENADKRDQVLNQVKTGQLFQVQGEEAIRKIEQDRLAILQQISKELSARAEVTGADSDKAAAAGAAKNADDASAQLDQTGQHVAALKGAVQGGLTSGFENFFQTIGRGTQSVARSFEDLAASVVGSLQKVATQMLATYLIKKLLGGLGSLGGGASSGGGAGGGGGGGFAQGGLIRGPGGPTADAIPARLSDGEFVVKADAVAAFGAHNLEAINRGLKVPSLAHLALPKFSEGGMVGANAGGGGASDIRLGIGLDEGLILKHLSSKAAANVILQHIVNNPKAAAKALGRSG